jgi:hypothetical protein
MRTKPGNDGQPAETFEDSEGEFAASFIGDYIVVGAPSDVRRFAETWRTNAIGVSTDELRRVMSFASKSNSANVVTYTNDRGRVQSFISAVTQARGKPMVAFGRLEEAAAKLPYSVTETFLEDRGFERVTRSPLGQFSTIFPLLFPEQTDPQKKPAESR